MKNKIIKLNTIITANCLLLTAYCFSQAPDIEWYKKLVADDIDFGVSAIQTPDGGYLLAATSNSPISGSKTVASLGSYDIWLIKLNSSQDIIWQKVIGGTGYDQVEKMKQTSDGNIILGAISTSGISAMKSDFCRGLNDYWLIKMDMEGNIIWDQTFGGSNFDNLRDVNETADGGFILTGSSISDASGDKSENHFPGGSFGSSDYWIIKTDAYGNLLWENTIGGDDGDSGNTGIGLEDGGFLIGGGSYSNASYDKTENAYNEYADDFWIIKLNADGSIVWDQTIGGLNGDACNSIIQLTGGNYLLGGISSSDISYDKTENSRGSADYWMVAINGAGNILWQKTMGGSLSDGLVAMYNCVDGKIIATGYSASGISGEKTSGNYGFNDFWSIKFSLDGTIFWDKTIGFTGNDIPANIIQTIDGGYLISGTTGFYDHSQAYYTKLESDGCLPSIELCNSLDDNCNGLIDDGIVETISISAGGPTTFCQGNTVLLSSTYSGTSIQWKKNGTDIAGATSPTYSVTKTGDYTCVTTSPCGSATSSIIHVTVNKNPNASISAGGATTFCAGGSVTLTEVPVAGSTYQWYKGASLIAGATSTNYIATTAGNYKCRVTKTASGCYKNSNVITVSVPCREGEDLIQENNSFSIYPNPNNGTFNLILKSSNGATSPLEGGVRGMTSLEIYNSLGQLIYSKQIESNDGNINETISINNLSSGIYFVRVGNKNYYSQQKLIMRSILWIE